MMKYTEETLSLSELRGALKPVFTDCHSQLLSAPAPHLSPAAVAYGVSPAAVPGSQWASCQLLLSLSLSPH